MEKFNLDTRAVIRLCVVAVLLVLFGTLGLSITGHLTFANSLYETLIILLSHFYHYNFTDTPSRLIVLTLIFSSFVLTAYLLKWFADYMMGLQGNMRRMRTKAKVDKLEGHYIVCGLGRVGAQVAKELASENVPFVALDRDLERVNEALAAGYLALPLDSTDEDSLRQAGIDRAAGLVAGLGDDSQNLLVTLSARYLSPDINIVARVNRGENVVKLKRAGANRVAIPYQIGGYHMASMVLRPNVIDYMDVVPAHEQDKELAVEEMVVGEGSKLSGQRLSSILDKDEINATVIAIKGSDGSSQVRPSGKELIYPGDRLIILGSKSDLTKASALFR